MKESFKASVTEYKNTKEEPLGVGCFGNVYLCSTIKGGWKMLVVVKEIKKEPNSQ